MCECLQTLNLTLVCGTFKDVGTSKIVGEYSPEAAASSAALAYVQERKNDAGAEEENRKGQQQPEASPREEEEEEAGRREAVVQITPLEQLVAGSIARMVAQTMLHPIDVVRTRRQAVGVAVRFDAATLLRGISPQV